jgi:hypothetical protein
MNYTIEVSVIFDFYFLNTTFLQSPGIAQEVTDWRNLSKKRESGRSLGGQVLAWWSRNCACSLDTCSHVWLGWCKWCQRIGFRFHFQGMAERGINMCFMLSSSFALYFICSSSLFFICIYSSKGKARPLELFYTWDWTWMLSLGGTSHYVTFYLGSSISILWWTLGLSNTFFTTGKNSRRIY